ncbi:hypothetical protein AALP_AA2G039900 [Arabis alpina]|uniref:Uncharacterized protein n=1 Tax=Arabis alpina TaxID=50452 RepID=A0A087HF78_ARAAL|nr:hypothetical protein AALP_AA2G039900 [Arabis alpina]
MFPSTISFSGIYNKLDSSTTMTKTVVGGGDSIRFHQRLCVKDIGISAMDSQLLMRMKLMVDDSALKYLRNVRQERALIKRMQEDHGLIYLCVIVSRN